MESTKINLAKALKLKGRLAGRLVAAQGKVIKYNSMPEGRTDEVNVRELDKEQLQLIDAIVSLRTAIYKANLGIYREIEEVKQKKLQLQFIQSMSTRNGTEPNLYGGDASTTYVAVIQQAEVGKRVKELERDVDALQDKIDTYNAVPERVEIENTILTLAS